MSRRTNLIEPKAVFGLLIALGVIWFVGHLLQQPRTGLVILVGGALTETEETRGASRERKVRKRVSQETTSHSLITRISC